MFISVPDLKKIRTFSTKLLAFCRDFRLKMSGLRFRPGCSYASADILRLGPHLVVLVILQYSTIFVYRTKLEKKILQNLTLPVSE
jgi:hypothetical protein